MFLYNMKRGACESTPFMYRFTTWRCILFYFTTHRLLHRHVISKISGVLKKACYYLILAPNDLTNLIFLPFAMIGFFHSPPKSWTVFPFLPEEFRFGMVWDGRS